VPERRFTPAEANELLATVRPAVERMVEQARELRRAVARREELRGITGGNGGGFEPGVPAEVDAAVESAAAELQRVVDELTAIGVQVKDLDSGLIDFPALREGEEVLLCWQLGEDEVAYWHTIDGGFAGRRPL
jgi:hypothetical protein